MIAKQPGEKAGVIRVTFALPDTMKAQMVHLVGDFNSWDRQAHPLRRVKAGRWEVTLELEAGQMYQFRYLVDGGDWLNDPEADGYVANAFGGYNSVVKT